MSVLKWKIKMFDEKQTNKLHLLFLDEVSKKWNPRTEIWKEEKKKKGNIKKERMKKCDFVTLYQM